MLLHNPFGPIFEKELRATSRRKRNYLLRVAYLGGLLLFLVLAYVSTAGFGSGGGVAWRVQRQNLLGQIFFMCFCLFSTGAMAIIGPVLTSTAISAERLHKTLHVLLMTPITSWQIVSGKLLSRLLVAFMLIGLSLPVLALVRLLGGVELDQMFGAIALCAATAIVGAAFGLFFSTFINRAYAVILLSYAAMLLLYLFIPMLVIVSTEANGGPPWWAIRFVSTMSPLLSSAFLSVPGAPMKGTGWEACALAQLGLAIVLSVTCALFLRRIQRREGAGGAENAAPAEEVQTTASDPVTPPQTLRKPKPRRRRREVGDNPVLWRELGLSLFKRRWQTWVGALAAVILLLISYAAFGSAGELGEEELQNVYACLFNGVAWLVVTVLSATAIAHEKESDTWTLLLSTPIRPKMIFVGKILGLYRRLLLPVILMSLHFFVFALCGVISWVAAAFVIWIIITFNTVWIATGVTLSLVLRKVTLAVVLNLLLGIGFYVVLPLVGLIVVQIASDHSQALENYWWSSPYYFIVVALDDFSPQFEPARQVRGPNNEALTGLQFLLRGFLVGVTYVLVSLSISWLTVNRFNRAVGRAEQLDPADSADISANPAVS